MVWITERNSWFDVMRRVRGKGNLVKVDTNFPLVFQSLLEVSHLPPASGRLLVKAKEKGSTAFILFGGKLGPPISLLGSRR